MPSARLRNVNRERNHFLKYPVDVGS